MHSGKPLIPCISERITQHLNISRISGSLMAIPLPSQPIQFVRDSYSGGWATGNSDDSSLYDFSTPVTEDVWLYALWDSYPYTIHYDANGGTGTMPDQKVASDPSVNTATLKSNEFNYNGRVFTGWNTKRDGTGTAYKENTSYAKLNITAANQIITLYAQWTTAKVKTIDAVTVKCAYSACYPVLPNEVKIHLSDGSTVVENVDWNKDQLDAIIDKGQSGLHLGDVFYIDSTSIVGFLNQRIRAKIVASDTIAPVSPGVGHRRCQNKRHIVRYHVWHKRH